MNKKIIRSILGSDVPILIWGSPGVGKTACIRAMAKDMGAEIVTLIGSTLDPSDVCGVPYVHNGELIMSTPAWAKKIKQCLDHGKQVWLFLDELSCAPPSVQAAFLRVVNERHVGDLDISGCKVIAAANHADTAAVGGDLSAAAANRWAHVEWQLSVDDWITGELSGWGQLRSSEHAAAAAAVCSFVRRKPGILLSVPVKIEQHTGPWPSPRSWSNAIALIATNTYNYSAVAATVGDSAALEFTHYMAELDLPDPQEVLRTGCLPSRGDKLAATLDSLAAYVSVAGIADESIVTTAWDILGKCRQDIALSSAKILVHNFPHICSEVMENFGEKIKGIKK